MLFSDHGGVAVGQAGQDAGGHHSAAADVAGFAEPFTPRELFEPPPHAIVTTEVDTDSFKRLAWTVSGRVSVCLDRFPADLDIGCCFVRVASGAARKLTFAVSGAYRFKVCGGGGWMINAVDGTSPSFWIPRSPIHRKLDHQGHILAEAAALICGFDITPEGLAISLEVPEGVHLDWVLWRFPAAANAIAAALDRPATLERQPIFLWGSKTMVRSAADLYQHLVHGQVYANDFVFPRHWKFYSEHDALALYVALDGLELATGKRLYWLLKRQVLFSVVSRQQADGRWENGEWTDLMESHYRSHNSAMLMMAGALEDQSEETIRAALAKAVAYSISRTDKTALGPWFLHDSLEESAEAMDEMLLQTGTRWIPSRALGKSPCNKLILNTHIDAVIAVDRYQQVTGDGQYAPQVLSARGTTRAVLGLRPAELLYRAVYWAIGLNLLPKPRAERLPAPLRAVKRLTWMYLIPNVHRIKQRYPRMVMPGGLIERHLSSLHFGTHYHAVNLMDLARYRRRFPDDDVGGIIARAIGAGARLLDHWAESKNQRFAIVVWADALYHLCTLERSAAYRRLLADAMLRLADLGLGFPPSLLGGDAEAVRPEHRRPCPSPANKLLRVANLSADGREAYIVVNPTQEELALEWQLPPLGTSLLWSRGDAPANMTSLQPLQVLARGWLWGTNCDG